MVVCELYFLSSVIKQLIRAALRTNGSRTSRHSCFVISLDNVHLPLYHSLVNFAQRRYAWPMTQDSKSVRAWCMLEEDGKRVMEMMSVGRRVDSWRTFGG